MQSPQNQLAASGLSVAGVFSGIGGLEQGFARAGISSALLCEIDPAAREILAQRFPGVPLHTDITTLRSLPRTDILAGGFPCQNLSLAGMNAGIFGPQSGLIKEVFRLVSAAKKKPKWIVLENVPFMLWQRKGEAIAYITKMLAELGFRWAYRVVDTRSFGLPQRRRRVFIVASRTEDPREVLFAQDSGEKLCTWEYPIAAGFSWTEGRAGLGWAVNAVPTLKGGSTIGIPSPPALWLPECDFVGTPHLLDGERLQGFEPDWTAVTVAGKPLRVGQRWKLVGNAISVPAATWLGSQLSTPGTFDESRTDRTWQRSVWPDAAWGEKGKVNAVHISEWPAKHRLPGIRQFLRHDLSPLSTKATRGFLLRARAGSLRFVEGFLESVERHLRHVESREYEKVA